MIIEWRCFRFPRLHPTEMILLVNGVYWVSAQVSITCRWSCNLFQKNILSWEDQVRLLWGITWETVQVWIPGHQNLRDANSGGQQRAWWWRQSRPQTVFDIIALSGLLAPWGGRCRHVCHQLCLTNLLIPFLKKQDRLLRSLHETKHYPRSPPVLHSRLPEFGAASSLLLKL